MARAELEQALRDGSSPARLRTLLLAELARSRAELRKPRSGYGEPVTVAFAPGVVAVAPVAPGPDPGNERAQQLSRLLTDALTEVGAGRLRAGEHDGFLALAAEGDCELAALAFDEAAEGIDRLRAKAVLMPALEATGLREVRTQVVDDTIRPHDDPEPRRRAARRILQRLRGMGKWGGYHTEFRHLARGFEGNELALALEVGEALVVAGLLLEKQSVGQRHVYLNPRRKADIERLIDEGAVPPGLKL